MSAFNELRTFAEPEITPNADVRPLGQDRLIRYRGSSLKEFFNRGSAERVARMGSSMTNNDGMSSVLAICGGIIFGALIDNVRRFGAGVRPGVRTYQVEAQQAVRLNWVP